MNAIRWARLLRLSQALHLPDAVSRFLAGRLWDTTVPATGYLPHSHGEVGVEDDLPHHPDCTDEIAVLEVK